MLLLLVPLLIYLAIVALIYFNQTAMLFPVSQVGPSDPLPANAERLALTAASGDRLVGVHLPPARASGESLLVLGFGGNAWNGDSAAAYLHDLYPEADVVAFHYRGYPPSGGAPSAAALKADAVQILDHVRARLRPARTVVVGFSVGSGVAAALAAQRTLDGLVLVTPFDSLTKVAADHYPWLPVRLLFRHRFEPAHDLAGTSVPVAVIAGARDDLVRPARTDGLRRAASGIVFDRTIEGASHNDIYDRPVFRQAMQDALIRITVPSSR